MKSTKRSSNLSVLLSTKKQAGVKFLRMSAASQRKYVEENRSAKRLGARVGRTFSIRKRAVRKAKK